MSADTTVWNIVCDGRSEKVANDPVFIKEK